MENHNHNYNVINTNNTCCSSSSSAFHHHHHRQNHDHSAHVLPPPPSSSSDEISSFLRQILIRSAATTSSAVPENPPRLFRSGTISFDGINGVSGGGDGGYLFSGGGYSVGNAGENVPVTSSPVGASENHDTDEYDCESEEGLEPLMEEPQPKRGSSKRTRAAEVHNLSEKRRRSRINEKMKALQNLIPNSNKTDKASMLDEAIEYLKQLQLQVQMLTMRNGLNLGLPGVLHPIQLPLQRMNFGEENRSSHVNMTNPFPAANQEGLSQGHPFMPSMPNIVGSVPARFGYQLHQSSEKEFCREDGLPRQQSNMEANDVSLPFDAVASDPKESSSLGALGKDHHKTKRT